MWRRKHASDPLGILKIRCDAQNREGAIFRMLRLIESRTRSSSRVQDLSRAPDVIRYVATRSEIQVWRTGRDFQRLRGDE